MCGCGWYDLHEHSALHQVPEDHVCLHPQQEPAVRASGVAAPGTRVLHRPRDVLPGARQRDQLQELQGTLV